MGFTPSTSLFEKDQTTGVKRRDVESTAARLDARTQEYAGTLRVGQAALSLLKNR
jgi:hypothetical protein